MGIAAIVAGVAALLGGLVYLAHKAEQKRVEELRMASEMMGFSFEAEAPVDTLGEFPLLGQGRRGRARNVSRGTLGGRAACIAEYSYVVSTGKNSHTVRQTVVAFTEPVAGLPDFDLSPEHVLHRLAQVFGYQDIDFDAHEEFSKHYLLRGQDEEAIRRRFGTDVLALLGGQRGWSVQAAGGRLLVFRAGKTTKGQDLPIMAADALRIGAALTG